MTKHLYQSYLDNRLQHEAFSQEMLCNAILQAEYEYLPSFTIEVLDEDDVRVEFDEKPFLADLRDRFDANLVEQHYQDYHERGLRSMEGR